MPSKIYVGNTLQVIGHKLGRHHKVLLVNFSEDDLDFGRYKPKVLPVPLAASELARYQELQSSSGFRFGTFGVSPLDFNGPASLRFMDSSAINEDGRSFITNIRGYFELKLRIFVQFKTAIQKAYDTLIVSFRFGSCYGNNPGNLAICYEQALKKYSGKCLDSVVLCLSLMSQTILMHWHSKKN